MKPLVVDASVAIKWFIPEKGSETAAALFDRQRPLIAPDLIRVEVANIIWKLHRKKHLTDDQSYQILADFLSMPVKIYDSQILIGRALEMAVQAGSTVYDCLYLALAVEAEGTMLTADERFVNGIKNTKWKSFAKLM